MNWRRSLIALVLVALPLTALLAYGLTRNPRFIPSPLPGRQAPEFALPVMDRTPPVSDDPAASADTVHLSDSAGEIVVLNFWASWCIPCRYEHEALTTVAAEYEGRGVEFYGVLYNDTPDNARVWLERMGGQPYPALLDPGSRVAIDYGLFGVPETFFIAPDGTVADKHVGPVTREVLVARIDSLISARAERVEGTPDTGGRRIESLVPAAESVP